MTCSRDVPIDIMGAQDFFCMHDVRLWHTNTSKFYWNILSLYSYFNFTHNLPWAIHPDLSVSMWIWAKIVMWIATSNGEIRLSRFIFWEIMTPVWLSRGQMSDLEQWAIIEPTAASSYIIDGQFLIWSGGK